MIDDYNDLADKMGYATLDLENKEKKTENPKANEILETESLKKDDEQKTEVRFFCLIHKAKYFTSNFHYNAKRSNSL